MTRDESNQHSHDIIMDFMESTKDDKNDMSNSTKAIIAQFLVSSRRGFNLCAQLNGEPYISAKQVTEVQLQELRRCIIDLQSVLNRMDNKEVIQ